MNSLVAVAVILAIINLVNSAAVDSVAPAPDTPVSEPGPGVGAPGDLKTASTFFWPWLYGGWGLGFGGPGYGFGGGWGYGGGGWGGGRPWY